MKTPGYLAVALVLLSGCTCTPIDEEPAQIHESETAGLVKHASGFEFPEKVDDFARVEVHNYDRAGENLSVGYNLFAQQIAATVYVYPTADAVPRDSLENYFADVWDDIMSQRTAAKAGDRKTFTLRQGKLSNDGLKQAYQEFDKSSEAFLFVMDDYFVKYRFTYPTDQAVKARTSIDAFMMNLDWPD